MLNFFEKKHDYVGIDIGSSGIKLVRLSGNADDEYSLIDYGHYSLPDDVFNQNSISKSDVVEEKLREIVGTHNLAGLKVITSVPAPALFTKRQRVPRLSMSDLREHIEFEAANFIPHGSEAVYLDFHVIGPSGKNHLDVLVVAVKREVVESYLEVFKAAELSVGVVDVDQFALQNVFELNYPQEKEKTVALVNVGSRYSGLSICRDGQCVLTGDIGVGGKSLTEEIAEAREISVDEAEALKRAGDESVQGLTQEFVSYAASEISRQISYFWSASGAEGGIDKIYVAGGGAQLEGFIEALEEEAATETRILDAMCTVELDKDIDSDSLSEMKSHLGIATGLALRKMGDKSELED